MFIFRYIKLLCNVLEWQKANGQTAARAVKNEDTTNNNTRFFSANSLSCGQSHLGNLKHTQYRSRARVRRNNIGVHREDTENKNKFLSSHTIKNIIIPSLRNDRPFTTTGNIEKITDKDDEVFTGRVMKHLQRSSENSCALEQKSVLPASRCVLEQKSSLPIRANYQKMVDSRLNGNAGLIFDRNGNNLLMIAPPTARKSEVNDFRGNSRIITGFQTFKKEIKVMNHIKTEIEDIQDFSAGKDCERNKNIQ